MKVGVLFCLFFLYNSTIYNQSNISFIKEELTFEIKNDSFHVQGIYYFKNNTVNAQNILINYPIPEDKVYSAVEDISVMKVNDNVKIRDIKKIRNGFIFPLIVDSITPIIITYAQGLKSNKAEYILLSTRKWKESLVEMTIKLIVSQEKKISNFSIEPDNEILFGDSVLYIWQKENYMPEKDFNVEFFD